MAETKNIARVEYAGRFITPTITARFYTPTTVDEIVQRSTAMRERALARRKTLRGAIEHWIWMARSRMARWMDPNA